MQPQRVLFAVLMAVAKPVGAQAISTTLEAAEREGAAFPRRAAPAVLPTVFSREFGGTANRECVTLTPPVPGGSLRSGEFIIRSSLIFSPGSPQAPSGYKILWVPEHSPFELHDTLLVRAARLASPGDSLRKIVAEWAYAPGSPQTTSGFTSLVSFPVGGRWLVVATAGPDWGCFVLGVTQATLDGFRDFYPRPNAPIGR